MLKNKNILLTMMLSLTLILSGCAESSNEGSEERNIDSSTSTDQTDPTEFQDVLLFAPCEKEGSRGEIRGPSKTILICEKRSSGFAWSEDNGSTTVSLGDSCFDDLNIGILRSDNNNFSSRMVCFDGILRPYYEVNESEYLEVSERELKILLKDLPENLGKKIIVFGKVMFFTSPGLVQAYISYKNHEDEYDYGLDDAFVFVETELTKDLVDGDQFKAWVNIREHTSGSTLGGGERRVPVLRVDAIQRVD